MYMYRCIWETCSICYCTMPFKCISYYQYLVVIIIKAMILLWYVVCGRILQVATAFI